MNAPEPAGPTSRDLRIGAIVVMLGGLALCWLGIGDKAHDHNAPLLVFAIALTFSAGFPLAVPPPSVQRDDVDDNDGRRWFWGAALAMIAGVVLGIAVVATLLDTPL
ncbi:MAG TPA: hypothetical protein VGF99_16090 [Myxococcota bacterium]